MKFYDTEDAYINAIKDCCKNIDRTLYSTEEVQELYNNMVEVFEQDPNDEYYVLHE
jgi:hypothetical protein